MKLGGTKTFGTVFIAFLIVALGSTAQTQKQPDCGKTPAPPWFNTEGKCNLKQHTYIFAGGVGWPKRNEKDCYLYIHVCGFSLNRKTTVPLVGSKCPDGKDLTQPTICCDEFNKAVKTKQPCDPMYDADCDGVPNDLDEDPLGPRPDADNKCKQLDYEVYVAYLKAGANENTAQGARRAANDDCNKRRTNKRCGIPTPDPPYEPLPKFPKDPDTDNKCKELGSDIYHVYLNAGANDHTAIGAGQAAREDCYRRRAGKL